MRRMKWGRGAVIIGAEISKFGSRRGKNPQELFAEAFEAKLKSVDMV